MTRYIIFSLFLTLFTQCKTEDHGQLKYSFFVAGHTYGSPNLKAAGLHPPFVAYIPQLNKNPNLSLGFFTGDVLKNYEKPIYPEGAVRDMEKIDVPTYIAAGNHDIDGDYEDYFGPYYQSLKHENDLFITLVPGLNNWNINGDQFSFLKSNLAEHALTSDRIFIFIHELIWWSPNNEYKDVKINYAKHFPGKTNFKSEIEPLLKSYKNDITIFAGDLGATTKVSSIMYDQYDNITLIGSGMGSNKSDNIILTEVYDEDIIYQIIPLNEGAKLGKIEDYKIQR